MTAENQRSMPASGGRGPGVRSFERPKNFRAGLARLLKYLERSKGLAALVVLLLLVSTAALLAGSYFLKPLINKYIVPGDFRGLATALLFLGCIYLVGVSASYLQSRLTVRLAQRTVNVIRGDLFDRMQGLPLRFFDTHTHGELMSRYTNDVDNVQLMLEQSLTQLVSGALTFAGSIVLMIVLSPLLFVFTAVVLALMVFASGKIGAKSRKYFQKQQTLLGQLNGNIEEAIGGLREVKVFNHEEAMQEAFSGINEDFRGAATKANFYAGVIMPIMGNLNNIVYAGTAVFGGMLTIAGRFDIGSLAAFLQYSRHVGQPINQITAQINNILAAIAGAERIFEVMDHEPEVDEGDVTLVPIRSDGAGGTKPVGRGEKAQRWVWSVPKDGPEKGAESVPLRGDVRFEKVSFSYDGKQPVLKDFTVHARPGHTIAFVGSTGAGKTTVTNLLNRFYDIDAGAITYDGIDVRRIRKDDLRRSLGMVLQDTHLFTGTVMENIRYGRLDATDEECLHAAKAASADSFIKRLPEGYGTTIQGDGANLSQGQRQLLAIARAYAASPPVLILDEATSSIDTRTERHIARGMAALFEGRTAFVIAHRLSTVRRADAIAVLEHGEIIEFGDHASLLKAKGHYYRLYAGLTELD
jgi:ATP-binding cassette, subfamily B, multidrug efflux pump